MRKKERRKFIRLKAYHLVKYRVLSAEKEQPTPLFATIKDIGAGGVCLKADQSLPESSTIALEINFPKLSHPISTLAKVVWVRPLGKKSQHYEVGAQFLDMEESVRKIIEERIRFVYRKTRERKGLFNLFR